MRGATWRPTSCRSCPSHFNPRPSCEGRRQTARSCRRHTGISIHAPHARGDDDGHAAGSQGHDFNPRPSCEGRRRLCRGGDLMSLFQSTPLMRGATQRSVLLDRPGEYFNPRPSCEGRQWHLKSTNIQKIFQSTPLMRGATEAARSNDGVARISIHAPHARGDFTGGQAQFPSQYFNPRPSCEGRL